MLLKIKQPLLHINAILDCGIKINVPPFIESGEKIIIDTRTLEYVKELIDEIKFSPNKYNN